MMLFTGLSGVAVVSWLRLAYIYELAQNPGQTGPANNGVFHLIAAEAVPLGSGRRAVA